MNIVCTYCYWVSIFRQFVDCLLYTSLRHLLVRKSVKTGQILVDIVTTTQIEHDFTELEMWIRDRQMMNNMNTAMNNTANVSGGTAPKCCPNCGTPTNGAKFCSNCGTKLA